MSTHTYLSAYLLEPAHPSRRTGWNRRLKRLAAVLPSRRLSARLTLGLASWTMVFVALVYIHGHQGLSDPLNLASHGHTSTLANARLATAIRAPELPGGPTGQLLPPGTMAAPYSFPNSYARGQCTWYVAGRRIVPSGWGNAASWYAHARAAGWSTGSTPAIAAIAWTPSGYVGHVAVVEAIEGNQVLISEMNYLGAYKIDKRWAPISSFKYIY